MDKVEEFLESQIDLIKAKKYMMFNYDEPQNCDLCSKSLKFERFLIDGEVKNTPQIKVTNEISMGQWAYMCSKCFSERGIEIRYGKGQLYERTEDNHWLLVSGFPPDEDNPSAWFGIPT